MRIIAFIDDATVIRRTPGHLGEPTAPPTLEAGEGGAPLGEIPAGEPGEAGWPGVPLIHRYNPCPPAKPGIL